MTINDFFSYSNDDGSVRVYEWVELQENINKIYILNSYGKKIVQLIISEEQNTHNEKFAQIKIIPYNIKKALDTSSLTKKFKRFKNAELTYHGSSDSTKQSKIHLKYLEDKKYKTIVDNSCELTQKSDCTQAGLEHLRKQYKNLQDEKERKRIKKILDDLK